MVELNSVNRRCFVSAVGGLAAVSSLTTAVSGESQEQKKDGYRRNGVKITTPDEWLRVIDSPQKWIGEDIVVKIGFSGHSRGYDRFFLVDESGRMNGCAVFFSDSDVESLPSVNKGVTFQAYAEIVDVVPSGPVSVPVLDFYWLDEL